MDENELLHSRARCVLGDDAMQRVRDARAVVIGASGVGAEVAKCLVLSGFASVVVADARPIGALSDAAAATNFCVRAGDEGALLAEVTARRLAELSLGTDVRAHAGDAPLDAAAPLWSGPLSVVVAAGAAPELERGLGDVCRARGVPFVAARADGILARVFVDAGPSHGFAGVPPHLPMREAAREAGRVHGPRGLRCHAAAMALDEAGPAPDAAAAAASSWAAALSLPAGEAAAAGALAGAAGRAASGAVAPLELLAASVAAHEAIKLVARRPAPLSQWLYADASDLLEEGAADGGGAPDPAGLPARQAALARALGPALCARLAPLRVLVAGAGALGCELLKGLALLGAAGAGRVTLADPDAARLPNLPSHCLLRPSDLGGPKAEVVAGRAREIGGGGCPAVEPVAHAAADTPESAAALGGAAFFRGLDAVLCGADSVAARAYLDARCAAAGVPLVDGGLDGALGHVQVTVPHLSELYSDARDPSPKEAPLCAIESFPTAPEHAADWARGRFQRAFGDKPAALAALLAASAPAPRHPDAARRSARAARRAPADWPACVAWARRKFERCFSHGPRRLLTAFPLDSKTADGTLFWASKPAPRPIPFDASDPAHASFVSSAARLAALAHGIPVPPDASGPAIAAEAARVPESQMRPFVFKGGARIVTEESEARGEAAQGDEAAPADAAALEAALSELAAAREEVLGRFAPGAVRPVPFDADAPGGAPLEFAAAAAALRARCYGLPEPSPLEVLARTARLAPALPTTAGAVAALQLLQLLQLARRAPASPLPLEAYANAFLNLDAPLLLAPRPAPARLSTAGPAGPFTAWDRWEVRGSPAMTVGQFVNRVEDERGLQVTGVFHGVAMVYMPLMPNHKARKPKPLASFLQAERVEVWEGGARAAELVLSYEDEEGEDVPGPPVRFLF